MKTKMTSDYLHRELNYCPETGIFSWKKSRGGRRPRVCGRSNGRGYIQICIDYKSYAAHRLAWFYVYGLWPAGQIDHINGDRMDNRISNLRVVDSITNQQNQRRAHVKNKSGFLGAHSSRGKFTSRIWVGGRRMYLGIFDTAAKANAAYVEAKRKFHHGCTI